MIALPGGLSIFGGVFVLTGNLTKLRERANQKATGFALITGIFIAAYTLWDKQAVTAFGIAPLVLDWGANVGRALLLAPFAVRYSEETLAEWREHKHEAIIVAVFDTPRLCLVLTAMTFTPVSYVAPAREMSILIGAALGARLLAEGDARRRLTAASAMVLGIVALAVG